MSHWEHRITFTHGNDYLQLVRNTTVAQSGHLKLLDVSSKVTAKTQRAGFVPSQ